MKQYIEKVLAQREQLMKDGFHLTDKEKLKELLESEYFNTYSLKQLLIAAKPSQDAKILTCTKTVLINIIMTALKRNDKAVLRQFAEMRARLGFEYLEMQRSDNDAAKKIFDQALFYDKVFKSFPYGIKKVVDTSKFYNSHGKDPRGRGNWIFSLNGEMHHFHDMLYSQAKKKALSIAREEGVEYLSVMP